MTCATGHQIQASNHFQFIVCWIHATKTYLDEEHQYAIFSHLDTIHNVTDRQTDTGQQQRLRLCIALGSKR